MRVRLKMRVRLGVKVRSETGLELRGEGVGLEWYLDLGCASILSVQWRGWADIFPYLAIMIMIIIIMMMIIIVICRD